MAIRKRSKRQTLHNDSYWSKFAQDCHLNSWFHFKEGVESLLT